MRISDWSSDVCSSDLLGARESDDLTRIRGIDATLADRLRVAGIRTFADIEAIPANAETALEREIGVPAGTIAEQRWRELALLLLEGRESSEERRVGKECVSTCRSRCSP